MRSTREVLEQAIAANFEDRAAHAAYADLLQEANDPHGELIAVQLALEEEHRSAAERRALAEREKTLLETHGRAWLGAFQIDLARDLQDPCRLTGIRYSRGWIAGVRLHRANYRTVQRLGKSPLGRFVQTLEIDSGYESPEDEWDEENLDVFPPLSIPEDTPPANEFYLALVETPFLPTLKFLRVGELRGAGEFAGRYSHLSSGVANLLPATLERTRSLEELHLLTTTRNTYPRFDPSSSFRTALPKLRVLRAYNLFNHATAILASNPSLGNLRQLQFHSHADDPCIDQRGPYLTLDDLRNVIYSPHLSSLEHLEFRLSNIGDEGCAEIVRAGALKRLKVLDLRHGRITDAGVQHLVASPDLRRLTWLELSRNAITSRGIELLRQSGVPFGADSQHEANDRDWLYEGDHE